MVKPSSDKIVWWQCKKGHEWQAAIKNRGLGRGCPYCAGKSVCVDNSLQTLYPELAKQWHPTKNRKLTPDDVTTGSRKKVWWQCKLGHEWQATVTERRRGSGCPYCSGKRVCNDNSLQRLNPQLAKQWHPIKNGNLAPNNVTANSQKKVWWQCEKGHEWEATVDKRTNGRGCPFCSGKRLCSDNSLQTHNPELSKQWHYIKNKGLTRNDVTKGSNKKVWWLCEKGHEWEAVVNNRQKGNGCPFCYKMKKEQ